MHSQPRAGTPTSVGAATLRSRRTPLPVTMLLDLAAGMAAALELRHGRVGPPHLGLSPDSVLVDPAGQLTLLDAGPDPDYAAPEQSGRLSRDVDERADLYALGVVLYELATGTRPFAGTRAAELTHAQLTRVPPPVVELPPGVAGVVHRLLAVLPEERYQTARGVLADLRRCQDDLAAYGEVDAFQPGLVDVPRGAAFTGRLYGRVRQLGQLSAARERVLQAGGTELIWVSADPGLGKSALLGAFGDSIVIGGGWVARTTFRATDTAPYAGLGRLLGDLAGHLMMRCGGELDGWRTRLAEELGGATEVLVALAPELAPLVGAGRAYPAPSGEPAGMLLRLGVRRLLSSVAGTGGPLTLILDDLHRIDAATVDLLRHVLADPDTTGVLVVGGYRPKELTGPLGGLLRERGPWRVGGTLTLRPLPDTVLAELLADTLRAGQRESAELARVVADRTGSRPLAVAEFLRELRQRKLLRFDEQHGWRWDAGAVADAPAVRALAPAVQSRLAGLPTRLLRMLQVAATFGGPVDLPALTRVTGLTGDELRDLVGAAVREGLLVQAPGHGQYRFTHEVVREAVRETLADPERAELDAAVGRMLLSQPGPADPEVVVRLCADLPGDDDQRTGVAEQALAASRHAYRLGALRVADDRIRTAIGLLPEQAWNRRVPLAYAVHLHAARTTDDPVRAGDLLDAASRYALDELAQARVLAQRGATAEALQLLRVDLPAEPQRWAAAARTTAGKLARRLAELRVDEFTGGLAASDPRVVLALDVIADAIVLTAPLDDWAALLAATGVRLAFEFGPTPSAALAFAGYAVALADRAGLCDGPAAASAAQAARVALALRDSCPASGLAARLAPVGALVRSLWYEPDVDPLACLDEGFRQGIEDGEPALALDNLMLAVAHRFVLGAPLSTLAEQVDQVRMLADRYGVPDLSGTAAGAIARLRGLPGRGQSPSIVGAVGAYLLGEAGANGVPQDRPGSFLGAVAACFHALALADSYPNADPDTQRAISAELVEHQARLDEWAGHGPAAFAAYAALLAAERTRLAGDAERAADRYARAVDTAREHGLVPVEALAAELGGRHALSRAQIGAAVAYLRRARDCYQRWRAPALVAHVDRTLAAVPTRPDRTFDQLDLLAMVRAFQAIAGELSPDRLVVTLLKLLIEHTHAERGALLLPAEPGLHLAATARSERGRITVLADLDRPSAAHVPMSVVEYVHRNGRPLGGRPEELPEELAGDAYLRRHAPSALLCTPIMRDDRLIAVLYLEHRHLSGWFGAEHLDLLDVLCAQAAIAFDNAYTHARLVAANQVLDAAFDRLPIGLILLGPDLTVRRASPRAVEVTGLPIEPGTPLMDLFEVLTPNGSDGLPYRLEPGFAPVGKNYDPIYRDVLIASPYGEPRRIHTSALPLRDPSDTLIGVTLWVSRIPPDPS